MCEYMCVMDVKISKDIRNKIAPILRNILQENIETCHKSGNRSSLGKLTTSVKTEKGKISEHMYRIFRYVCGIGTYQTLCIMVVLVMVVVAVVVVHRRIVFMYPVK